MEKIEKKFNKDFVKMLDWNYTDMNDENNTVKILQEEIRDYLRHFVIELMKNGDIYIRDERTNNFLCGYNTKLQEIWDKASKYNLT